MKQKLLSVFALLSMAVTGAWAQIPSETIVTTVSNFDMDHLTSHGTYFDVELLTTGEATIDDDGMTANEGIKIKAKNGNKINDLAIVCTYQPGYVLMDNLSVTAGTIAIKRMSHETIIFITGIGNADEVTFTDLSTKPHYKEIQLNYFVGVNDRADLEQMVNDHAGTKVGIYHTRKFKENVVATICLPFGVEAFTSGSIYEFVDINYDEGEGKWIASFTQKVKDASEVMSAPFTTAGVPYLFKPNKTEAVTFVGTNHNVLTNVALYDDQITSIASTDYDWQLTGTYQRIDWDQSLGNYYGFVSAYKDGVEVDFTSEIVEAGQFVKSAAGGYFPAFRGFLEYGDFTPAPSRGLAVEKASAPTSVVVRLINKTDEETDGVKTVKTTVASNDCWYDLQGRSYSSKPAKAGIYVKNGVKMIVK